MRTIILDLETVPDPKALECFGPVRPKANLKDAAKIAADIAEKEADRADKMGLDPDACRIVALGWVVVGGGDPLCDICVNEDEEREALDVFWKSYFYGSAHTPRLLTFNGFKFDLPVLMRRSMYLGVKYPTLNIDRYRSPHVDIWQKLSFNGAISAHSLAFYAKRLGIGTLDKVDGADVAKLAAAGEWDAIRDHCLSDVGLTHALANRLGLLEV